MSSAGQTSATACSQVTIKHPPVKLPVMLLMQATMFLAQPKRARLFVLQERLASEHRPILLRRCVARLLCTSSGSIKRNGVPGWIIPKLIRTDFLLCCRFWFLRGSNRTIESNTMSNINLHDCDGEYLFLAMPFRS